ncbi:MAG: TIM barrel protein [Ferruginibacter sp.]|nr:TIM barrel protein [Cytophagales bacterium]
MNSEPSRRKFLAQLGLTTVAASLPGWAEAFTGGESAASAMQLGCAAIAWGGKDAQAIREVGSLGFKGIQLRSNIYAEYGTKPEALKALLDEANIQMPVFSSGNANINLGTDEAKAQLEKHVGHARLVKGVGGKFLQLTNSSRPKEGKPTPEDLKKYGTLLTEIGKRTADEGITAVYHNHMEQLGETPEEVDQILAAVDTRYVKLLLDVAHYTQGGGNPAKAIGQYASILQVMHLKDVRAMTDATSNRRYQFVELGQGRVDLPAVFTALDKIKYSGWAIVELDSVPDPSRTPLEASTISRDYLRGKLKMKI